MDETLIQKHMTTLGLTREEAIQLIKDDEEIDHMTSIKQVNSDLSAEQLAATKKARQSDRKMGEKCKPKEKEANTEKLALMDAIATAVQNLGAIDLERTNLEREMIFFQNGVKYKITLACPRK